MEDIQELKDRYYQEDNFPNRLGVELEELAPGYSRVSLQVEEGMTNFHGITHGGALFTLADTAFGLASNSRGTAVALQMSANFLAPSGPGEKLTATCREEHLTRSTGIYSIEVEKGEGKEEREPVALLRGVVYRKKK